MNSKQRRQFDRALVRYMQGEHDAHFSARAARTMQRLLWRGSSPVVTFEARYRRAGPLVRAWLVARQHALRSSAKMPRFGAGSWHVPTVQRTQTAQSNPPATPGTFYPALVVQCRYCDGTGYLYRDTVNPVRCDRCNSTPIMPPNPDPCALLRLGYTTRDVRGAAALESDLSPDQAAMLRALRATRHP